MHEFKYIDDMLWCENTRLDNPVEEFGTPLYIYSKQSVIDHCRAVENSFGGLNHLSCYAVKANSNINILKIIAAEGLGADIGSSGELFLALKAGFAPEKITYTGVGKRDDEIEYALQNNIMAFNCESAEEISIINEISGRLQKYPHVLLRVNFDIEAKTHPYISTGKKHNKFGVERSNVFDIINESRKLSNIKVLGIHTHIGSQITHPEIFVHAAEEAVDLVNELRGKGIELLQLNFGGGFGVQYHDFVSHPWLPVDDERPDTKFTTVTLIESALPVLKKSNCMVLIQPGRSIIAHAGILVTEVIQRKNNAGKTFIIVDAGMNDLLRPSLYGSYHQISPLRIKSSETEKVDIVGPLCESGDFFGLDRNVSIVDRGDKLAIMCTGAYGYVLASNYNGRLRAAEILIDGNKWELIRDREEFIDLL